MLVQPFPIARLTPRPHALAAGCWMVMAGEHPVMSPPTHDLYAYAYQRAVRIVAAERARLRDEPSLN